MGRVNAGLRVFPDHEALSRAAAELVASRAAAAIASRGRALLAISGGGTPLEAYALLGGPDYRARVDWERLFVFWADERCVPPGHPESNYGAAREAWLGRVPLPQANLVRVRGELEPEAAASDYAKALARFARTPRRWPRFDLAVLGLGADGHTASLFPGSPPEMDAPVLAVTAGYHGRPAARVTLTPPVLNDARAALFLVSGAGKAAALAGVLEGEHDPARWPAQRVRPHAGELLYFADRPAAEGLQG